MSQADGQLESRRTFSSIPVNPGMIAGVLRLLAFVDELPPGATGALYFGDEGVVLVEARKICWAVARSMRVRLTDILRNQSTPPLPRASVEAIYRTCKAEGIPVGEGLVASGLVSESGLRSALFKHNSEAIVQLAQAMATPDGFVPHTRTGYDSRYAFSTCELLAVLGAREDPARATAALQELSDTLVPESSGAAFTRSGSAAGSLVIAVDARCDFPVSDLRDVCDWVTGLFDVARTFDPQVVAARAAWGGRAALVTWRTSEVGFVGLCSSRAAAARLVSRLGERTTSMTRLVASMPHDQGPA